MARELIAVDTSVLIPWLNRTEFREGSHFEQLGATDRIVLPPVTLAEAFAGPPLPSDMADALRGLPLLAPLDGYWERAGLLRARSLRLARRARLGDALIAQACIDADVPLLTADSDFQVFADVGGLRLYEA